MPEAVGSERRAIFAYLPIGAAMVLSWTLVIAYFATGDGHLDVMRHALGRDFVNYWTAGQLILAGDIGDIFDPAAFLLQLRTLFDPALPLHFWSYPPPMLLLVAPLGLVGYGAGYLLFMLLSFAAMMLAVREWREIHPLMLALSPAVAANLILGQNGFFTAALLIGGMALLERRPLLSGVLLGLLVVKPHLGLLLPVALAAERRWQTVAATALTALGVCGLTVVAFGLQPWRDFVNLALPMQTAMMNEGSGPFQWMMPSVFMAARLLGFSASTAWWIQVPFLLAAAGATWYVWRSPATRSRKVAVLFAATLLGSPQSFFYDLIPLTIGALFLMDRGFERSPWPAMVYALPLLLIPLNVGPLPAAPLIIGAMLLFALRRSRAENWPVGSVGLL